MSKRKRVVLSLNDKINIIESLQKGVTGRKLADKYGVGTSTISDIKKNTDSIVKFICKLNCNDRSKHRKAMRKANNELLEEALYRWYLQKRSTGLAISGPLLCKKALQLNKKIGGDKSFVASNGWLYRYKSRYGIHDLQIQSKQISANVADSFKDSFKRELEESDYDLDFVYNAAETRLNWKLLPSKAFVYQPGDSAPAYKTNEERVTILVCANATGTHKLPLLLIGKSKSSKCFKNISIPLIYKNHKSAWMDTDNFIDWYDGIFINEVIKYQNRIGKQGKVLLLMDNAQVYSSARLLERENGMFKVKLLASNVAPLLKPMNSIITTLKQLYRKQLLRRLLSVEEDNAEVVASFSKQINIKECCYMVADAWAYMEKNTLSKAWHKILKRENNDLITTDDSIVEDINQLIASIQICQECDADDIKAWLDCDSIDQGYEIPSTDVIVENIQLVNKKQDRNGKMEERKNEIEEHLNPENDAVPSHLEAFQSLETAFKWYERQTESDTVSLMQLNKILDLAATKTKNCLR